MIFERTVVCFLYCYSPMSYLLHDGYSCDLCHSQVQKVCPCNGNRHPDSSTWTQHGLGLTQARGCTDIIIRISGKNKSVLPPPKNEKFKFSKRPKKEEDKAKVRPWVWFASEWSLSELQHHQPVNSVKQSHQNMNAGPGNVYPMLVFVVITIPPLACSQGRREGGHYDQKQLRREHSMVHNQKQLRRERSMVQLRTNPQII